MPVPVKESLKYAAVLLLFVLAAFVVSWCAVFSFWIGARVFHSVQAVRTGEAIGSVVLLPVRALLQLGGGMLDDMTQLTNPYLYATINGALLGFLGYSLCRRWIFRPKSGG